MHRLLGFPALDTLIAQQRIPVMIAISIGNGSGDAQGSERDLEYDTMSGLYAEFVETEMLPLVQKQYNVKLTKDPNGRVIRKLLTAHGSITNISSLTRLRSPSASGWRWEIVTI